MKAFKSIFTTISITTFKSIAIFLAFGLLMTSCQREELEEEVIVVLQEGEIDDSKEEEIAEPEKEELDNPFIGIYIGNSQSYKWGYREIHDNMTGDLLEIVATRDSTSFTENDTLFIEKGIDNHHFTIRATGGISFINEFAETNYIYQEMSNSFEDFHGLEGYSTTRVRLLFDNEGNVNASYISDSYSDSRPSTGYSDIFFGIKQ